MLAFAIVTVESLWLRVIATGRSLTSIHANRAISPAFASFGLYGNANFHIYEGRLDRQQYPRCFMHKRCRNYLKCL